MAHECEFVAGNVVSVDPISEGELRRTRFRYSRLHHLVACILAWESNDGAVRVGDQFERDVAGHELH